VQGTTHRNTGWGRGGHERQRRRSCDRGWGPGSGASGQTVRSTEWGRQRAGGESIHGVAAGDRTSVAERWGGRRRTGIPWLPPGAHTMGAEEVCVPALCPQAEPMVAVGASAAEGQWEAGEARLGVLVDGARGEGGVMDVLVGGGAGGSAADGAAGAAGQFTVQNADRDDVVRGGGMAGEGRDFGGRKGGPVWK